MENSQDQEKNIPIAEDVRNPVVTDSQPRILIDEQIKKSDNKQTNLVALKYALDNQIGWQKYAEAKTALLCTVSATALFGLAKDMMDHKPTNIGFFIFLFAAGLSFFISALSLTPAIIKSPDENILAISYWRYVKDKKLEDLLDKIKTYDEEAQIKDLAYAHLKGSQITSRKYFHFRIGIIIFLLGLMSYVGASFYNHITQCN